MRISNFSTKRAGLTAIAGACMLLLSSLFVSAQQWVVANKDRTRPEQGSYQNTAPTTYTSFDAARYNGYNEIRFTTLNESDAQKFVVEYSVNGSDYSEAGQVVPAGKPYFLKHYTTDTRPMLYRLRTISKNGKFNYSTPFVLDGIDRSPVTVYPTIVETNRINVNSSWPVEQITIFAQDGTQVLTKSINGQADFIPVNIPTLPKGMYLITFYGKGWQTTSKFLVP